MNYDSIVDKYSAQLGVPGLWVRAVIMTESTRGQWPPTPDQEHAYREEPKISDASYGLMQLLFSTAVGLGYQGTPEGLYDVDTNILYGTRLIKNLIQKYGISDVRRMYSAYNSGKPDLFQSSEQVKANVARFLANLQTITASFVAGSPMAVAAGGGIVTALVFLILWQWHATKGS